MAGKVFAGVLTGFIGGAVWQNAVKHMVILALLFHGEHPLSAVSTANSVSLVASFVVWAYYIYRATQLGSARQVWGKNLIGIAYGLIFFGASMKLSSAILSSSRSSQHDSMTIFVVAWGISAALFFFGRYLFKSDFD